MGPVYSQGGFAGCVSHLVGMPLDKVYTKRINYQRVAREDMDKECFFMTRSQYARVFQLSPDVAHVQFRLFDPQGRGVVTATDVIGALALVASASTDARMRFILHMVDGNRDNRINASELVLAMHSTTRGLARMKRLAAPSLAIIQDLVEECFTFPDIAVDEKGTVRIEDAVIFIQTHKRCMTYFKCLSTAFGVGDTTDLFKVEAALLKELAELDAKLDTMEAADDVVDAKAYYRERGGDAALCMVPGIPGLEEVRVAYQDDRKLDGGGDAVSTTTGSTRRHKRGSNPRASVTAAAVAATMKKIMSKEDQAAKDAMDAQRSRRTKRALAAQVTTKSALLPDALCFARGYKRVDAPGDVGGAGSQVPLSELQIAHKWESLPQTTYGNITLDIDLVIDLVEAAGSMITDADAARAIECMEKDQLGAVSLTDFIHWWRARTQAKRAAVIKGDPWRERLGVFYGGCRRVLGTVQEVGKVVKMRMKRIEEEREHEQEEEEERRRGKRRHRPQASDATDAGVVDGPRVVRSGDGGGDGGGGGEGGKQATTRSRPVTSTSSSTTAKLAGSLAVGHMTTAQSSLVVDVMGTSSDTSTARAFASRGHGDILTYRADALAKELIEEEHAERVKKPSLLRPEEIRPMGLVLWCDLVLKPATTPAQVDLLIDQIRCAFYNIPEDYSRPFFIACQVRPIHVGTKDPVRILRVEFLGKKDLLTEIEDQLPLSQPLSSVVKRVNVRADIGLNIKEMVTLTGQYLGYAKRAWGPQEDELGDKEMNPFVFNRKVRERRSAAMKAAEGTKGMDVATLKEHLNDRGLSTQGTWGDLRARVKQAFVLQADRIGFGELSAFGESLVRAIFKRFDTDKDGALSFREMVCLQRALHQAPLRDVREYEAAARESELLVNDKANLTVEGAIAHYERYGGLVDDVARLGVGSIDDFLTGNVTINVEMLTSPLAQLEAIFESNPWMQWLHKTSAFLTRFTKDAYFELEVSHLSQLFSSPTHMPSFLTLPGWPAAKGMELQKLLADGKQGVVPELRHAILDYFGPQSEYVTPIEYGTLFDAAATIKKLGGDPPPAPAAAESANPKDANNRHTRDIECMVPEGTIEEIEALRREVGMLKGALERSLPPAQRREYEQMLDQSSARLAALERTMESAIHASLAYLLRSYDGVRELVQDITYLGIGNSRVTVRLQMQNLSFIDLLPAGKGELHPHTAKEKDREAKAKARKKAAIEMYESWKARREKGLEGDETMSLASKSGAETRTQDPYYVERNLFLKGCAARERGEEADRHLAMQLWTQVAEMRARRCKGTDGEAVALNNLAVLTYEYSNSNLKDIHRALHLSTRAVDIMQACSFYLTRRAVREDPEIMEFVREQVAAESCGALMPSAAPRDIPAPECVAYVIMLANMLTIMDAVGPPQDEMEEDRYHAYKERLSGIWRYSVKGDMQAAVGRGVEMKGLKVISLTPDEVLPSKYIVSVSQDDANDLPKSLKVSHTKVTAKGALGVTNLDLLATLDPQKASRFRARHSRREVVMRRKQKEMEERLAKQKKAEADRVILLKQKYSAETQEKLAREHHVVSPMEKLQAQAEAAAVKLFGADKAEALKDNLSKARAGLKDLLSKGNAVIQQGREKGSQALGRVKAVKQPAQREKKDGGPALPFSKGLGAILPASQRLWSSMATPQQHPPQPPPPQFQPPAAATFAQQQQPGFPFGQPPAGLGVTSPAMADSSSSSLMHTTGAGGVQMQDPFMQPVPPLHFSMGLPPPTPPQQHDQVDTTTRPSTASKKTVRMTATFNID